jgi:hypothetical protein
MKITAARGDILKSGLRHRRGKQREGSGIQYSRLGSNGFPHRSSVNISCYLVTGNCLTHTSRPQYYNKAWLTCISQGLPGYEAV